MPKRPDDGWQHQLRALGGLIREQRTRARLSLRELAQRTKLSNAYLSQIERGLHEPSVHVIKALAGALDLSAETLLRQAGIIERSSTAADLPDVVEAIDADPRLTDEQRTALVSLYRSFVNRD